MRSLYNNTNHKRLWVAATIIAVVIIVGFVLSVPHTRDIPQDTALNMAPSSVPGVTLRDTFKKGVHTLSGSIDAPNACTTVSAEATLQGDAEAQSILVDITMPEDAGVCLQVPKPTAFQATLTAPAGLPVVVRVNGLQATTSAP